MTYYKKVPPPAQTSNCHAVRTQTSDPVKRKSRLKRNPEFPSILLSNVRSITNKIEELDILMRGKQIDVACLTETWLTNSSILSLDGYNAYILPRKSADEKKEEISHGGGVGLICRNDTPSRILDPPIPKSPELEVLWVWVRPRFLPRGVSSLIFGVVYYPPKAPFRKTLVNYLQYSVDHFRSKYPFAGIVICGDFNDIKPSWIESSLSLKQVVKSPTRGSNLLDMVFTNLEQYYNEPEITASIGLSDHLTVTWRPTHSSRRKVIKQTVTYRPIRDEQIPAFKGKLTLQNWTPIYRLPSAEDMTNAFCDQLQKMFEEHFPEKKRVVGNETKPWITPDIKELILRRDNLYNSNRAESNKLRNIVVRKIKYARKQHGRLTVQKLLSSDSKKFHSTVQNILGRKQKNVELRNEKGEKLTANAINDHFATICTKYPGLTSLPDLPSITEIPVIEAETIQTAFLKLDASKASFPGELPIKLIKACSNELAVPFTAVVNQCLSEGTFPTRFKTAVVIPIPKKSSVESANDLRPISKTSIFSKVLEGIVFKWLFEDISENLDPRQYGFRPGHSTVHYLIRLIRDILEHLEIDGAYIDCIIADFVKAFDLLDHSVVIDEATYLGARQIVLRMVGSFLTNRKQKVQLPNGETSNIRELTCGAAQGSKLGPLAFLIVINKLLREIMERYKFADDLSTLLLRLLSQSIQPDPILTVMRKIEDEANQVKLTLSQEKTVLFRVNFLKRPVPDPPCGGPKAVKTVKILGVHLDADLKWNTHVSSIVSKTAFLLRSFAYLRRFGMKTEIMVVCYKCYIRPLTEYACPVWHSALTIDQSDKIEGLQKRACKIILGSSYVDYEMSLKVLKLESLKERRHTLVMDFGRKILDSETHRDLLPDFEARQTQHSTRLREITKNAAKLERPPIHSSERYLKSFGPYFVKHYNGDPEKL